ncbi:MAG: chromosome segregation protein SMC, partial [Mangrovicoccus sp.]|nr:chromosome segregation protein SMC [Mangrovicoccus sp.]
GLRARSDSAQAQIADLQARLGQIDADAERESALDGDARETLDRLRSEAANIARQQGNEAEEQERAELQAEAADAALARQEQELSEAAQVLARDSARHETVQRAISEATNAQSSAAAALAKSDGALCEERAKSEAAAQAQEAASAALEQAHGDLQRAEAAMGDVETRREAAREAHGAAKSDRAAAHSALRALSGEIDTLARLVEQSRASAGQVLDALQVSRGFETALGAVLGDDLGEPLRDGGAGSGWEDLPALDPAPALPAGVTALADEVTGPPALARRLSQVGIVAAEAGPALQSQLAPGQRLVSRQGDVWRWDGLVRVAGESPSAAALRLQQRNRLAQLRAEQETAQAKCQELEQLEKAASEALKEASDAEAAARLARRAADSALAEAGRRHSRAGLERDQAEGRMTRLRAAHDTHLAEQSAAADRLATARAEGENLPDLAALKARVEAHRTTVEAARIAVMSRRAARDELRRAIEGRRRRLDRIARDEAQWRKRLDTAAARAGDLATRRAQCAAELQVALPLPKQLAAQSQTLDGDIAKAEARKGQADAAVSQGEAGLREARSAEKEAERALAELREGRAAAEARLEAAGDGVRAAAERLTETLDQSPEQARAAQDPDALTGSDPGEIEARVQRLRRQRDALGAVNLRAEEDAKEVEAEITQLAGDKTDLDAAIAKLRGGIASLNREGRERLLTAFEQVNENFGTLFTHLFGGGEARLQLIESDDPLEAGLEILCQPPGKKLSTLSLLSGGEQTLTALALIFAVFLANPAPICVLDEVDAPLDDANVTRFCDLLDDMARRTRTRFLVITHHAVTMARMDRLFGVTMGEQGISQLVSVDLKDAESLVA